MMAPQRLSRLCLPLSDLGEAAGAGETRDSGDTEETEQTELSAGTTTPSIDMPSPTTWTGPSGPYRWRCPAPVCSQPRRPPRPPDRLMAPGIDRKLQVGTVGEQIQLVRDVSVVGPVPVQVVWRKKCQDPDRRGNRYLRSLEARDLDHVRVLRGTLVEVG